MISYTIRFFKTVLLLFLFQTIGQSQTVQSVDFQLKYDPSTCWYDFYIIIQDGYAEGPGQRTQFNSQISFVIPTGSDIAFAEKYMPLQSNQNYTGTIPMEWNFGPTVSNPASSPGNDFISVVPTLSPASQYNNIYAGDTIKLFSLDITLTPNCGKGVRLFENGVDPDSNGEGMNGADYSHGFTVGGFAQLYNENAPLVSPAPPQVIELTNNSDVDIEIELETSGSACQGPIEYSWTGPNGYFSTAEDVLISPAFPESYGEYEVIITDSIGCVDTTSILIENQGGGAVNELTIVGLKLNPTFEHISAHLDILGDDNRNSTFLFEYRLTGTSAYQIAAQSSRAHPSYVVDGAPLNENFHASSAMFLNPNASYDLRITVTDPDGGGNIFEETISTLKMPSTPQNANTVYVIPGSGGGSGTMADPYLGIQAAMNNVAPGDVVEVGDGVYAHFTITTSGTSEQPIIVKTTNLHGAIVDGGNIPSGIITIGSFADSIQHVVIDGFRIRNGGWGIDAQNTQYLTVRNNKITDVDFGFYNRRENGWEHDQYLSNNEIVGRTSWPQLNGEIPPGRGIDIRGNRNVVSFNSISHFGDGISTDGAPYKVSYALDIHNNFINKVVDDLIEIDGILSNARVYRNSGFNGRMGVSLAPVFGGPAYVFRNEFYNLESSTFKMNRSPSGLVIVNNTALKVGNGMSSSSGWQNSIFKNNAFASGTYCFEEYDLVDMSVDDWNYNGYKSLRSGTSGQPWFKWDNTQYSNISALNSSGLLGLNSIEIAMSDFVNATIPTAYGTEALPQNVDLKPSNGSVLIDAGQDLTNIHLTSVFDGNPDIGAYEKNQSMPQYGHDFGTVCERVDLSTRTWNGSVSNAWFHPANWSPCGVPIHITDVTIEGGASNYPFLNSDVVIKNLYILEGGLLEINEASTTIKLVGE
ncbi:MAG: right-handed parallel beta-helix repeat-containing protein [Saprospiraceae bacterium]|nr:right-handed parallel beta-helix repeat-containing protein [Saprospiraceae bacterium]